MWPSQVSQCSHLARLCAGPPLSAIQQPLAPNQHRKSRARRYLEDKVGSISSLPPPPPPPPPSISVEADTLLICCCSCCSYFVVDQAELRDRHIREITIGFYAAAGKHTESSELAAGDRQFSLSIGQIKVSATLWYFMGSRVITSLAPWSRSAHKIDTCSLQHAHFMYSELPLFWPPLGTWPD